MPRVNNDLVLMGYLNIQSLVLKVQELKKDIRNKRFNILGITESWLSKCIQSNSLGIDGYNLIRKEKSGGKRGGGVLVYIKSEFKYQILDLVDNIEQLFLKVSFNGFSFVFGVVYKASDVNYKSFINSLETSLTIAVIH